MSGIPGRARAGVDTVVIRVTACCGATERPVRGRSKVKPYPHPDASRCHRVSLCGLILDLTTTSIAARTPATSTADTLHAGRSVSAVLLTLLLPPQLRLRHTTDTAATEVGLLSLHTPETAQLLIPLLLPLGNQLLVRVLVLEQPLVELFRDGLALVVEVVDVAGARVRDLEDRPKGLVLAFAVRRGVLRITHAVGVGEECVFNVGEACWWGLSVFGGADWRHCGGSSGCVEGRGEQDHAQSSFVLSTSEAFRESCRGGGTVV